MVLFGCTHSELYLGYTGRKPTARAKAAEVKALKAEYRSVRAIAAELGISVGSAHGMLKAPAAVE